MNRLEAEAARLIDQAAAAGFHLEELAVYSRKQAQCEPAVIGRVGEHWLLSEPDADGSGLMVILEVESGDQARFALNPVSGPHDLTQLLRRTDARRRVFEPERRHNQNSRFMPVTAPLAQWQRLGARDRRRLRQGGLIASASGLGLTAVDLLLPATNFSALDLSVVLLGAAALTLSQALKWRSAWLGRRNRALDGALNAGLSERTYREHWERAPETDEWGAPSLPTLCTDPEVMAAWTPVWTEAHQTGDARLTDAITGLLSSLPAEIDDQTRHWITGLAERAARQQRGEEPQLHQGAARAIEALLDSRDELRSSMEAVHALGTLMSDHAPDDVSTDTGTEQPHRHRAATPPRSTS